MSSRLHFAVLAHTNEPCVTDMIRSLWDLHPGCGVSVFNGGRNPEFFANQGVPICPYSRPLRYGNLTAFHYGTMRWLEETRQPYDFLITLDHDLMPLRSGLIDYLDAHVPDMGYLGARFRVADDPANWTLGGSTVEQVNANWKRRWQPLLGTDVPYWAFNPGQVFTHGLVNRFLDHRTIQPLMEVAARSRIWAIEEMIYPTLAVAVGGEPASWKGEYSLLFDGHSPDRVRELASDPEVFFLHRVGMQLTAPDRTTIHNIVKGRDNGDLLASTTEGPQTSSQPSLWRRARQRVRSFLGRNYNAWYVRYRA